MDKETLEKIYLLRKIRPERTWVSAMKKDILDSHVGERETERVSVWEYFAQPALQSKMKLAGAFVFLFFFGYLVLPLLPSSYDQVAYAPVPEVEEEVTEEEEDINVVPKDKEESVDVARKEQPVEKEFAVLKEGLYGLQRQVLGSMIKDEGELEVETWTDKDIVEYYIAKIEEEEDDSVQVMTMGVQEEEEKDERVEMLIEANENDDYEEAFNLIVDILAK